jgi:hypothetical protein
MQDRQQNWMLLKISDEKTLPLRERLSLNMSLKLSLFAITHCEEQIASSPERIILVYQI